MFKDAGEQKNKAAAIDLNFLNVYLRKVHVIIKKELQTINV